jgi:acyl carrier protein
MSTLNQRVLADVLELMSSMAEDWEYGGDISTETRVFADLGFESLDLVVLGTALQERHGRLPFAEFLAQIGQREEPDVTIGELVAFVSDNVRNPIGEGV